MQITEAVQSCFAFELLAGPRDTEHTHSGGSRCGDAGVRVFEHDAILRRMAEEAGCSQIRLGMWLTVFDVVGGDQHSRFGKRAMAQTSARDCF